MAGVKRPREEPVTKNSSSADSPYISMFETFRTELDEHHDRRERIIKASRDITASSKKIIFSLQRVKSLGEEIPDSLLKSKDFSQHSSTIRDRFTAVEPELQGINAHRYYRQVSPGIQEFLEAVLFQHYLETETLLSLEGCASKLPGSIPLTEEDYILGLFDTTGEMMRYAITQLASRGELPSGSSSGQANILTALQDLRRSLETLDASGSHGLARQIDRKMGTTKASVEKVENAVYSMTVRGKERPKGWNPGFEAPREVGEVES